jgi:hypothetical protein
MTLKRNALLAALGLVIAGGAASTASADPLVHPRRAEVNARLAHQAYRIDHARLTGHMTAAKAWRLHHADYRVRLQEARFARHHHGHITRFEQRRLNREENRIGHRIG